MRKDDTTTSTITTTALLLLLLLLLLITSTGLQHEDGGWYSYYDWDLPVHTSHAVAALL